VFPAWLFQDGVVLQSEEIGMKIKAVLLVALGLILTASGSEAVEGQESAMRPPVPHDQVISANPFLLLWEWANVEYERKISPTATWGLAGSWLSLDGGDESYKSLNGFLRYYPQGAALSGFYIGGRMGIHQVSDRDDEGHAFGLGIDVGYSWVMGVKRNFYVGLGIGATRLFGGDIDDGSVTIPSVRLLNVGFAF